MLRRGQTFVNARSGDDVLPHLWMVISDPQKSRNEVLIVNLTTVQGSNVDTTCIVRRGEHPFVSRDSFVYYAEARCTREADLEALLIRKMLSESAILSAELLEKVTRGAVESPHTKKKYKELLRVQALPGLPPAE